MTMTRDKIAELKRLAEAATPGEWQFGSYAAGILITADGRDKYYPIATMCGDWAIPWDSTDESKLAFNDAAFIAAFNPATASVLLALAERALEPQGQALPESCEMTPEQMTAYAQSVADRASQLALPAGPVPAHYQAVLTALGDMLKCFDDGVGQDWSAATLDKARIAYHDAIKSPAGSVPEVESLKNQLDAEKMNSDMWFDRLQDALKRLEQYEVAQPAVDGLMTASKPFVDLAHAVQDSDMVVGNDDDYCALSATGAWSSAHVTKKQCRDLKRAYKAARAALCQPAEEGDKA